MSAVTSSGSQFQRIFIHSGGTSVNEKAALEILPAWGINQSLAGFSGYGRLTARAHITSGGT